MFAFQCKFSVEKGWQSIDGKVSAAVARFLSFHKTLFAEACDASQKAL